MKLTTTFKRLLLTAIWSVFCLGLKAQTYELHVTNEQQVSSKIYQFDVYLMRTGGTPLELAGIQFGLGFDVTVLNGGTLTFEYVANSTELASSNLASVTYSIGVAAQTIGDKSYRFFNRSAGTFAAQGAGTIISASRTACTSVGTRVGTYRLINTADFAASSKMNHVFSTSVGSGRTNTVIVANTGSSAVSITSASSNLGYQSSGTCLQNIALNGCALMSSPSHTNVLCHGGTTGTASANVTGNTQAVSYTIAGPTVNTTGASTGTFTGLSAGTYVISYTSGSCSGNTGNIVITQPSAALALLDENSGVSCPGGTTTVTLSATGGTAPYTYSNGITTNSTGVFTQTGGTTVTYTVTDDNDCTASEEVTVTNGVDNTDPLITQCASDQTVAAGTGNVPNMTGGVVATDNCSSVTVTQSPVAGSTLGEGTHTITFTATDASNNTSTCTATLTVSSTCNFTIADTIVGSKNACKYMGTLSPLNATYSIATTSASGFTWTVSNPATMSIISGQGTSSIEVHYAVTFTTGTISVEVTSACGGPATRSLAITKTAPVLGVVTGPKNACSYIGTNTEVTYSVAPIENALSYEWLMPNASTILVSGQGTTSIQVRFESGYTAGAIKVRAMSGCAYSSYKSVTVATTVPGIPAKIFGEQNACPYIDADTISYFYIRQVPNATFYNWSTPQGAVIVRTGSAANGTNISPVSTLQTSDTMIGIKFDNTFVNATNLTVGSGSICGLSTGVRALALKRTVAATPGTIVGPTNVCPLMVGSENPSGTPTTYTIRKVKYATSYIWTIPAGVTVLSHSGTGINDTAITVRFESSFVVPASIGVQSVTGCGQSAVRALALKKLLPATPGSIVGPKDPCPTIGSTATYTIRKALNANSYTWTVPSGGTIVAHPGGAGTANDTIVEVQWTSAFTTGSISVQSHNNCASSAVRSLALARKLPATPGTITGPTDPCPTIGGTATYSIAALPAYATSVLWTAPSGASIVGPDNQLSVQIAYTSAFTTGSVSVVGVNACANSAPKALTISRKLPPTPGSITTTPGTCENRVYTYSIASLPLYTDSIIWTVPAGGTITSAGAQGLSITVSYTSELITGAVTARGVNKCAQGATARSLTINYAACPVGGSTPLTKVIPTVRPQEVLSMEAKVFPNPSTTSFKLQVNTTAKEQIHVRIVDVMGRAHKVLQMMPGEILNFGSELRTGTYMVEIRQGNNRTTQQIIKL